MEVREEEGSVLDACLERLHVSGVGDGVSNIKWGCLGNF